MSNILDQFHFLRPIWLVALPIGIGLWAWVWHCTRPDRGVARQIAPHLRRHLLIPAQRNSFLNPLKLLLPIWMIGIVAVAGPSWRRQPSPFGKDQADLMIVLRLSDSMLSSDLPPSRLEQVRGKISDLLEARRGAGTGLIVYSGSAHLVMPITEDADVIDQMLQSVSPDIMPTPGDALLDALVLAAKQFSKNGSSGSVVVVADGVDKTTVSSITASANKLPPLQFYVPLRGDEALLASGITEAAQQLASPLQTIAPDATDISRVVERANRSIVAVTDADTTAWRDDGYYLLPFVTLAGLAWSRRGWSLDI